MTEHDREDEIRRRYRELAREEPPRALDDAILDAARRELETRPAPLVAPSGRRRWAVPVAAAAVIVLSAVVALHVQREQPDEELSAPPAAPQVTEKVPQSAVAPRAEVQQERLAPPASDAETGAARKKESMPAERRAARQPPVALQSAPRAGQAANTVQPVPPAPRPAPHLEDTAQPKPRGERGQFSPDPTPPAAEAPQMQMKPAAPMLAERQRESAARDSVRQREQFGSLAKRADVSEPPERTLERIAALRREGRHKEADELYTEFRRRFPDYRIPEAMREQVVPR